MPFTMKALSCDPSRIKGMSEKLIVSHYENNYGGAVKRLNLIEEQLAGLDFAKVPGFLLNGLKREQLIAANSMILHELFFDGLGEESRPRRDLKAAIERDFAPSSAGTPSSPPWARRSAAARAGCCCPGRRAIRNRQSVGLGPLPHACGRHADPRPRYVSSIPITWTMAQGRSLCRYVHGCDPLEQCGPPVRLTRALSSNADGKRAKTWPQRLAAVRGGSGPLDE